MSKHKEADEKLHSTKSMKDFHMRRQQPSQRNRNPVPPPKGTNANNQYR